MSESDVIPARRSRRAASLTAQALWKIQIEDDQKFSQRPIKPVSSITCEKTQQITAQPSKQTQKRNSSESISKVPPKKLHFGSKEIKKEQVSCGGHKFSATKPVQFGNRSKNSGKLTASVAPLIKSVQPKPKQTNIPATPNHVNPIILLPVSLQPNDRTGSGDLSLLTLRPNANLLSCLGLNSSDNAPSGSVPKVGAWGPSNVCFNIKSDNVYIPATVSHNNKTAKVSNDVVQVEPLNLKMGETVVPTTSFQSKTLGVVKIKTNVVRPMCTKYQPNSVRQSVKPNILSDRRTNPTKKAISSSPLLSVINERLLEVAKNKSKLDGSKSPSPDYACSSPETDDLHRTRTPSYGIKQIKLRHKAVPPVGTPEYKMFKTKVQTDRNRVNVTRPKIKIKRQDSDENRPLTIPQSPSQSSEENYDVNNGWKWSGKPYTSLVFSVARGQYVPRRCYPSMIRKDPEGDDTVVAVRDCVFLLSGEDGGSPYVAKVTSLWERENSEEMVASVLWYYRPEHTEDIRQQDGTICEDELFSSRHQDEVSVACVEDRCYVFNYSQYARVRARLAKDETWEMYDARRIVPRLPGTVKRSGIRRTVSGESAPDPDNLFFSRKLYDVKGKRVLKYLPQPQSLYHDTGGNRPTLLSTS